MSKPSVDEMTRSDPQKFGLFVYLGHQSFFGFDGLRRRPRCARRSLPEAVSPHPRTPPEGWSANHALLSLITFASPVVLGGQPQRGEAQGGEPQQGVPQRGVPQARDSQRGEPQRGVPRWGEARRGDPKRGQPQRGEPRVGEPQRGVPQRREPRGGEPQWGAIGWHQSRRCNAHRLQHLRRLRMGREA
jgi:hypothetical protein